MNNIIKSLVGMGGMTDQVIATDFLISAKAGIRNIAFAITESASPEVRALLREELKHAVQTHERITNYMIEKGTYHPHDLGEQIATDMKITETALQLSEKL
ncbi:spore coat protein [Anaerobacillus sp. MEB173]|uniref:spore coat protein n=1 Tax=Anaerobacillus sp. MEB173 TaxID=3383345 RepID=UPI003F90DB65